MKRLLPLGALTFLSGCYTLQQGYYQTKLLFAREDLEDVVKRGDESAERLEKLRAVPKILAFAREHIGLKTGGSYQKYVRLPPDSKALTWVVQAAERRSLVRKTWWFPVVGEQPYLGYFHKADAEALQSELKSERYDTRMSGVDAFSLLGFLSDPLYSSMIDGRSLVELVDLLIHESVHQTLYVPNASTFNESFADFVAKKATVIYFESHATEIADAAGTIARYLEQARREHEVSKVFQEFLEAAKVSLQAFYEAARNDPLLKDEEAFLAKRSQKFDELANEYTLKVRPRAAGTWYENAFAAGKINNAVILGYSLYEANPEPFEQALSHANGNIATMVRNLQHCLADGDVDSAAREHVLWQRVAGCQGAKEDSVP